MSLKGAVLIWTNPSEVVEEVERLVQMVSLEVQRDAKVNCPVDTGTLQSSITVQKARADQSQVLYLVGTNVFYAPFVEFGTSKMQAQPFLGKALAAGQAKYGR